MGNLWEYAAQNHIQNMIHLSYKGLFHLLGNPWQYVLVFHNRSNQLEYTTSSHIQDVSVIANHTYSRIHLLLLGIHLANVLSIHILDIAFDDVFDS